MNQRKQQWQRANRYIRSRASTRAAAAPRLVIFLLEGDNVRFLGCGASESYGWLKGRIADHSAPATESMLFRAARGRSSRGRLRADGAVVRHGRSHWCAAGRQRARRPRTGLRARNRAIPHVNRVVDDAPRACSYRKISHGAAGWCRRISWSDMITLGPHRSAQNAGVAPRANERPPGVHRSDQVVQDSTTRSSAVP